MRKFISFILALTVVLSLFAFPASAEETITDLQKVYTNLSTYLYTPYYQNSEYYDEYQKVMDEAGELLESDDITQAEISKYYTEIRQAYAKLMQDTYDYSSLEELLKAYDALDGSIFTEETWKKVLSIRDSAKKELDSPSLFSRTENMTEKQYAAYINNHIKTFTTDFNAAFNRLIFLPTPEEMTSEYLSGFIKLVRFCAREELLSQATGWEEFLDALDEADKAVAAAKPKEGQLNKAYDTLLETYFNVCNAAYDFSASQETLTKYHILTSKSFSTKSWERYSVTATALEKRLKKPHFFFIPSNADKATCEKYASNYLSALPSAVNSAQEALIPVESFDKLRSLCDKYRDKTTMDGLDIKLRLLKNRVAEGEQVLSNEEATHKDVTDAIANIESAYNDLVVSEGHLLEEQGKVVKQDSKTSQFTIIFFVSTVLLSVLIAVFLSKQFYGKANWSK
ncbi:MAG: hypothetical protein IJC26_01945 [Clostridia bacterium]|nr:hypothetical protein [Clostridia bacterium]